MLDRLVMRLVEWRIAARFWTRHLLASLNIGLVVATALTAWALAATPQIVEFYAVELSRPRPDLTALAAALTSAAAFSWLLYAASRQLPRLFIFAETGDRAPLWAQPVREQLSRLIALAPWAGAAAGLATAADLLTLRAEPFDAEAVAAGARADPFGLSPIEIAERAGAGYALIAAGAAATLIGIWIWSRYGAERPRRARARGPLGRAGAAAVWSLAAATLAAILLVSVLAALEPALGIVRVAGVDVTAALQRLGPIACLYLALCALFTLVLTVLVALPALFAPELVAPALLGALAWAAWAETSNTALGAPEAAPAAGRAAAASAPGPEADFKVWARRLLAARGPARPGARRPVYVVAASGGGAYAAAHASHVLAALQDADPRFAEHVFAISGVSGGAVGATLFRAVDAATAPRTDAPATGAFGGGPRAQALRRIVLGAHMGPVLVEIPGLPATQLLGARADGGRDRAAVLRDTFAAAAGGLAPGGAVDGAAAARLLRGEFGALWAPEIGRPALVLNTTSVENGLSMAFAPFALGAASDGLVLSYAEWFEGRRPPAVGALDAAIASARFPGVLPAFSPAPRASFVDGGYSDASGADTALKLFDAIAEATRTDPELSARLEPRLLLLDDAAAGEGAGGGVVLDALTPLIAVLSVQSQQARRAVARAREAFRRTEGEGLVSVSFDSQALALPLAWRLSAATHHAVAATIGRPEDCDPARAARPRAEDRAQRLINLRAKNGCALVRILSTLG